MSLCQQNSIGTSVYAIADGVVEKVSDLELDHTVDTPVGLNSRTNSIIIKHTNIYSSYVHIKQFSALFKVGEKVKQYEYYGIN